MDQETETIAAVLFAQAERLFEHEVTPARLTEADTGAWAGGLWQAIAESGLPLSLIPEAQGGIGMSIVEALRLIGRSAYHAVPLPLAETILSGAVWAEASGTSIEAS